MRCGVLHVLQCVFLRQNLCKGKECRLKNGVGALAHADLFGKVDGVNEIHADVVLNNITLCLCREVMRELFGIPLAVYEEGSAGFDVAYHLKTLGNIRGVVARHEVCLGDIVRRANPVIAEAQVADGDTTGLLGVILEIRLNVLVGMVADDLDGVLVGTNRTVATNTPELALDGSFGCGIGSIRIFGQRQVGNIIHNTDRKLMARLILLELFKDSECGRRRRIFRTKTITATDNGEIAFSGFIQCRNDILIQRLTDRTRLLGTIHDGNLLDRLRENVNKMLYRERTIQANLHKTDLLAMRIEVVDNLFQGIAERTHADDDAIGIRCTVVVKEAVIRAKLCVDLIHIAFNDCRELVIHGVACLTVLEEDVTVLVRTARMRMLRIQGMVAECLDGIHIAHLREVIIIPNGNFLNLMRGTEAVKEIEERNLALNGGQMGDRSKIHNLLDIAFCKHCKARLAARHNV